LGEKEGNSSAGKVKNEQGEEKAWEGERSSMETSTRCKRGTGGDGEKEKKTCRKKKAGPRQREKKKAQFERRKKKRAALLMGKGK